MPAARPAAGRGGKKASGAKATPGNPSPTTSRAAKLQRAHAAGASGGPAPAWIDDAELLGAYDEGASSLGPDWAGDLDTDSTGSGAGGNNGGSGPQPDADGFTPAPAPTTPGTLPLSGSGRGSRSVGPVQPKGMAADAAGAFLGIIAAAFLQNVLSGRWTDWLRAKFLNETRSTVTIPNAGGRTATKNPDGTLTLPPDLSGGGGQSFGGTTGQPIPGGST